MNSFLLQSFKGGISDFEDKGITGSFKFGQSLDIRKTIDSLSCQQALATEGAGIVVDTVRFIVSTSLGTTYGFGSLGKIYRRTLAGTWSLLYTDADGAITGACEWFLNTGKVYLFWATATKLHCKELPGSDVWADVDALAGWPKTTLTTSTYHTMVQAVGSLQVANEDYIAMVGYDGSYTHQALNIFKKNYAKAMLERGNYLIVGAPSKNTTSESDIVEWDTSSLAYNDRRPLQGGAINAMIDTDLPLMQVGTDGALYYGDMQNRLPILNIPGGGYCNPSGVTNDEGLALFGIYGNSLGYNGVWSYGRKKLNQDRTLNFEYNIGTCDEIGTVARVGSTILVTYKNGANYYVKKVDTATKATAYYYSLDLKAPSKLNYLPIWGPIVLTMKPLPASCQVEVYYKLDKQGSFIQAKMEDGTTAFATTGGQEVVFFAQEKAKIFEIEIKLTPSVNTTPEVYKVEVYFE
jgi:hypothetical protein